MPKKAQDFLMDATLGEKGYELQNAAQEEKIVLSIEEGAVPVALLKEAKAKMHTGKEKSFFAKLNDALKATGKPQAKDKATFFRLLAIMINAGVPLIKSLDTIGDQTVNKMLKNSSSEMARAIEKGGTLSESMIRYPNIFSESHIGMVKSGEASGSLNSILKQLAIEVEKSASISRKVKGALMYPGFVLIVMIVVISAMMILVVPKISELFLNSGQKLPTLTIVVIAISNFMQAHWQLLFGALGGLIVGISAGLKTPQGKYIGDWIIIHVPIFGGLVQKSILARFSRSLSNLLGSGVPIIQGLIINAKGLGNEIYRKRVELASEDIARGIPLGESLRDSPEFPDMMVQMIGVGEQTAQLDTIAIKIAEYYEDEVDTMVASLSKVIEPLMLVMVGGVVGLIIAAIMVPIIQLTSMAGTV